MGVRNWAGPSAVTNAAAAPSVLTPPRFPRVSPWRRAGTSTSSSTQGRVIAQEVKALGRDMILGPTVNIAPHSAVGPELRGLRRGSVPRGAHGRRLRAGRAGRRRDPVRQALRRQQPGVRAPPHRRSDRRPHASRDLLPGLQGGRPGGGRVGGDVRLQQAERPVLRREPVPAHRDRCGRAGASRASSSRTGAARTAPPRPINAGMDLEMPGGEPMRRWLRPAAHTRRPATAAAGSPKRRCWRPSPRAR